ncbi:23S rRNA (uracil(1939)-C(5))-methyltransferase RlmD, partial [bacterium]
MPKAGEIITLDITSYANGGDGIGRYNNLIVFVPYACINDLVTVKIREVKKSYARADIIKIVNPSEQRIQAKCKYYYHYKDKEDLYCGGCNWMHINEAEQLKAKEGLVHNAFKSIGKIDNYKWEGIIKSPKIWEYRNKVQLPCAENKKDKLFTGFYKPRTHTIIPIDKCLMQSAHVQAIINKFIERAKHYTLWPYNEKTHKGSLRHLVIRTNKEKKLLITIVSVKLPSNALKNLAKDLKKEFSNIAGIFHNYNPLNTNVILGKKFTCLTGDNYIFERIGNIEYRLQTASFFQINSFQLENLYNTVKDYLDPKGAEQIVDLYCGAGGIGLYLSKHVKSVIGIEEIEQAVISAQENLAYNKIFNTSFYKGKVEYIIEKIALPKKIDAVIINPPRKGVKPLVIEKIAGISPEKIIYVSCSPVTLARDLKLLKESGYNLKRAKAVD